MRAEAASAICARMARREAMVMHDMLCVEVFLPRQRLYAAAAISPREMPDDVLRCAAEAPPVLLCSYFMLFALCFSLFRYAMMPC